MSKNDLDEMIQDVNSRTKFAKIPYLDLHEEGHYRLRVLPLKEDSKEGGKKYPTYRIFTHAGFSNPNTKERSIFKCIGNGCPLCSVAKQKKQAGDSEAWAYAAQVFFLYYVIDAGGNMKILKAPGKLHNEIEAEWLSKAKGEKVNIFDSKTGRVIQITRRGKKQETKWVVKTALEISPISTKAMEALENSKPLNEITMTYTKEQLDMVAKGIAWKALPQKNSEEKKNNTEITTKQEAPKSETKRTPLVDVSAKVDLFPEDGDVPDHGPEIHDEELEKMRAKLFGVKSTK
jgi:hypothetical protein